MLRRYVRADRVLVDAPCTCSGVLRRHPENRWRLDELGDLRRVQREILDRAARLVAPGGRLIYGTCSVLPEENNGQVRRFLSRHPEFEVLPTSELWGAERATQLGDGRTLRVSPHRHGTDGFFGVVLQRAN